MKWLLAFLLFLLLVLQYHIWFADGGYRDVRQLRLQLNMQQQENEALRRRNLHLEAEVRDLKQGLQAVEERAREELGMIKQGETFFHIVEPADKNAQQKKTR